MSATEIAKLYENLSLADEDRAVLEMSEEASVDGIKDVDRCLVGKVLSGKKVNREAFKGLIEQIWNPFGHVEVELVGDNLFMFYFNNGEDRNQVLQRGSWHFSNSLIVLEKPVGSGNISKLGFNKVDFWVQIHDIPLLCMNRRTVKWLKLGKTDKVTMVSLKYERLPDFCYACGRIGHGMKECLDEEAMKVALEGSPTKFGYWLKATILEKLKTRFNPQGNGSSSDRARSSGTSHETEGDGFVSLRPGYLVPQKKNMANPAAAMRKLIEEKQQETLQPIGGVGPPQNNEMCMDGPGHGLMRPQSRISSPLHKLLEVSMTVMRSPKGPAPSSGLSKNKLVSKKGKSPLKNSSSPRCPRSKQNETTYQTMADGQVCKRKVVFDLPEEDNRNPKKGKVSTLKLETIILVEPEIQVRREQ
ncbi:hypothetical protein EZV62_004275 [Acer yangbiense]|uniref:CCHC-type domain-containing protein n=1 Tax=Acer yangbiense TaxID=1000413 RepID=A0A5C7IJ96_9ROSI|nr:hypothetical protein EZV62_004275 [Acer yangbiense]